MSTLDAAIKDYLESANKTSARVYVVGQYDVEVKSPFHETPDEFIKMEETEPYFDKIEEDPDVLLITENREQADKLFHGKHSGFYVTPGCYGKILYRSGWFLGEYDVHIAQDDDDSYAYADGDLVYDETGCSDAPQELDLVDEYQLPDEISWEEEVVAKFKTYREAYDARDKAQAHADYEYGYGESETLHDFHVR